jgi:hypothetical protein
MGQKQAILCKICKVSRGNGYAEISTVLDCFLIE